MHNRDISTSHNNNNNSVRADASLERVQSLISKASLLGVDEGRLAQAEQACVSRNEAVTAALQLAVRAHPYSADIFRVRLLDARRLALHHAATAAQGNTVCTRRWSHYDEY